MMLIFLIIIGVAAYFIYKSIGKNETNFKDHEALLNERFARGEIDLDTFKQMKSELNK